MFNSQILDVAIGVVFIYLLLSLACTALNELIAHVLALRARTLETGIKELLDEGWAETLFKHPLVDGMSKGTKKPSYLEAHHFSAALIDIIKDKAEKAAAATGGAPAVPTPGA